MTPKTRRPINPFPKTSATLLENIKRQRVADQEAAARGSRRSSSRIKTQRTEDQDLASRGSRRSSWRIKTQRMADQDAAAGGSRRSAWRIKTQQVEDQVVRGATTSGIGSNQKLE